MSTPGRRFPWLLLVTLVLVPLALIGGLVLALVLGGWSVLYSLGFFGDAPVAYDTPTQLASIPVPVQPNSLAWSPDGGYLAAGTYGTSSDPSGSGEVYLVNVTGASLKATLPITGWVYGLAFSPDGKWLAVASSQTYPPGAAPAELAVFDVPGFKPRFTAQAGGPRHGFTDLAWAADGKTLFAIDSPDANGADADVRRWDLPAFAEQSAIRGPPNPRSFYALAASPDGRTLAVAEHSAATGSKMIRLIDLTDGSEQTSFRIGEDLMFTSRLGFSTDGQDLGVFDGRSLTWWDRETGRPTAPDPARFAVPWAGRCQTMAITTLAPDCQRQARGFGRHRGFGDLGWDNRGNEFGAFVEVSRVAPPKTWTWRVGSAQNAPPVAFSQDGTKLAGAVPQSGGAAILIWAVPQ